MRRDVLRLIEAFPGCTQTQVSAFMGEDAKPYIDALVAEGVVEEVMRRDGLRGRPARRLTAASNGVETIRVTERHAQAHADAKMAATRWLLALHDDKAAQTMLVELLSAPHLYSAETALEDLMRRCELETGCKGWMRAPRRLAEMGVVELRERRGAGRQTMIRLLAPPPYPLG